MKFATVFGALMLAGAAFAAQAKTELIVYTAVEADELAKFKQAIEADNPDLDIKWVRDSTGIITAKLLAEKANPQADVVWGLAATSLKLLADQGYFQPYAPKGVEALEQKYVDSAKPPQWVGQRAWVASLCFNTVEAEKLKLPTPTSWQDLTQPEFKGKVVMPNPNSSGTGFLDVSAWIQMCARNALARSPRENNAPCQFSSPIEAGRANASPRLPEGERMMPSGRVFNRSARSSAS